MTGTKSMMASCPSLLLLIALNILATSAIPVINSSTSRQGESAQQGRSAESTDDLIIDLPKGYTLEQFLLENPDFTSNWFAENIDNLPLNNYEEKEIQSFDDFVHQTKSLPDAVIESNVNSKGTFGHGVNHKEKFEDSVGVITDVEAVDHEKDFQISGESKIESAPSFTSDEVPIANLENNAQDSNTVSEYEDEPIGDNLLVQYYDLQHFYVKPPNGSSIAQLSGTENKDSGEDASKDKYTSDDSISEFQLANSLTSERNKDIDTSSLISDKEKDFSESISQEGEIVKDIETSAVGQNIPPVFQPESSALLPIDYEEHSTNNFLFPSGQTQNSDQVISDEVKELFGDIYDDYDYQFPSPPAPLTAEELNRPPSPFYDGDYGVDYDTPQFQNNFPDTQSRSNSFDSTIINQPFSAERPAVLPPTDLIHPVFDFHEGEIERELPPLVPQPGISQFPEFARGEDINLQPGGVSSTHSYNSREVAQELLLQAQNFNLPIPLEEVDLQEKNSQPSFDTNELFTNGLTAEEAIKYVKEKSRVEKERSSLTVSGSESSDDGIVSTDVESSEEQIQQAAEKSKFEFTPVHFPDNEIKQTEELITSDFEFAPESKDEKHEESTKDNLDSIDFKDSQGRASKIASAFKEDENQTFDENKIQSEGLSIEDAIKYAKLKAEKESGKAFTSETEKGLSEKDRTIAQEEINKMILKISDELRSTSSNQPTDSEFYKMLTEAMSKRFIDEYVTVKSTSLNTNNLIEHTELVQELEIEDGKADQAPRHEIVPSIVASHPEGNFDVYKTSSESESASEIEETQSFDEKKVQSEGLEFLEAIKYAKLKAQGKLGNSNSSEMEIRVSDDDKEIAHEEMFKIVLNVLSQAEESESNSAKANDLDYYTMLTDAMTERFIDEHKTDNSASVESEVRMNSTATEEQPQEKTIVMAEEIINLFSQINEYQNKKDLNSEEGEFVFIPSVIPGLSEQSSQLKPTQVDVSSTLKEEIKKAETPIREQKLIVEKPNTRRGYDGQISSSVSQTESVERYYPDHQSATSSVKDQNIEAKAVGHDVKVSQTETIERIYPEGQAHTSSLRDYRPEASPIPYHSNGYAYEQQQQGHIVGAPLTLIQVPQTVERPKGFFRTLGETGSVIKAGAAAFQRKVDIFRTIFKKSYRDHENTDVHLAVVPAYISQVEPNAHPVEVIDYPRSSISTSVDSSVSTSINFQKLDGPPKGLERINEEEFEKDNFDIKESILEKAAPLLSSKLSPPSAPARPDFDIRSYQEVSAPSQFVGLSHGSQAYGGQGNYAPVMVYSQNPEHHAQEEYTGRRREHLGFRASDLHDSVNGLYHAARGGYDNVRNSISRFASWFSPSSYSASQDELSTEQVVAPQQVQHHQPLHYQPVYLAVHHPQQQEQEKKQKTGFLGKLKKKFIPWL